MTLQQSILDRFPYKLDSFQQTAAETIEQGHHVLVTAHTSAGKSTVAEYAIIKAFLENKKIIYTSPVKTLSNQKFAEFVKKFAEFNPGNGIGIQTGDVKLNPDAQCTVMTTEILRNQLYHADQFSDVGYVVFDEVHYINDKSRGSVWEECIMRLPPHVIMVMLSATMANPEEFADWIRSIKPNKEVRIVSTLYRPVPLRFYALVPNPRTFDGNGTLTEVINTGHMSIILEGDHGSFNETGYNTMKQRFNRIQAHVFDDDAKESVVRKALTALANGDKLPYNLLNTLNPLLNFLHLNTCMPAIFFTLSRKRCDKYAETVNVSLVSHEEKREIENIFDFHIRKLDSYEHYEQVANMKRWLMKGVAVHHSGLFPLLKEIVEITFSKGLIKALFATETFAIGINMPTKTVVFMDVMKFTAGFQRPLCVEEFKQMAGRAGRRGLDTVGHVIYFPVNEMLDTKDVIKMMLGRLQPIQSRFLMNPAFIIRGLWTIADNAGADNNIIELSKRMMLQTEYVKRNQGAVAEKAMIEKCISRCRKEIEEYDQGGTLQELCKKASAPFANKKAKQLLERQIDELSKNDKQRYNMVSSLMRKLDDLSMQNERLVAAQNETIEKDMKNCVAFLRSLRFLTESGGDISDLCKSHITSKGIFAMHISQCDEIILSELFFDGLFDSFIHDPVSFASVLAMFLHEGDLVDDSASADATEVVGEDMRKQLYMIQQAAEDVHYLMSNYRLGIPFKVCYTYVPVVWEWCNGKHFEAICKNSGVFEGNIIRTLQKLLNLLDEMRTACETLDMMEWVQTIDKTKELVARDIMKTPSIYLTNAS